MTESPDVTGPKIGVGETVWYQTNINRERSAVDGLSERAELCFYRLRTHYIWRGGNLAYDPASICSKMGYKTVRSFNPGFDELVKAGVVVIEDGMIRFPYADTIIAEVQSARDKKAKFGALGGDGRTSAYASPKIGSYAAQSEHDRNTGGIPAERHFGNEQNQALSQSSKNNHQEPLKEEPTGRARESGGGSDVDLVIKEFYDIAGSLWGHDTVRRERKDVHRNVTEATSWLNLSKGSVQAVVTAIEAALKHYAKTKSCPGTLAAVCMSMPGHIEIAAKPCNLTSGSRAPIGSVKTDEQAFWIPIRKEIALAGYTDLADELRHISETEGTEAANRRAREVQEFVQQKKAEAA